MIDFFSEEYQLISTEFSIATKHLERSFEILINLRYESFLSGAYSCAMIDLTQGLERLLKLALCLQFYKDNNVMPRNGELKNFGHDLTKLFNALSDQFGLCSLDPENQEYCTRFKISRFNNDIYQIFDFLSKFAKSDRYFNLDLLTQPCNRQNKKQSFYSWYALCLDYMVRMHNQDLVQIYFKKLPVEDIDFASMIAIDPSNGLYSSQTISSFNFYLRKGGHHILVRIYTTIFLIHTIIEKTKLLDISIEYEEKHPIVGCLPIATDALALFIYKFKEAYFDDFILIELTQAKISSYY